MKGCLSFIGGVTVLIVLVAIAAGGGSSASSSSSSSSTETQETEAASAAPASTHASASTGRLCGHTYASAHTSCPFAASIYSVYLDEIATGNAFPEHVTGFSPVTHHSYTLQCVGGAQIRCTSGNIRVTFNYPSESEASPPAEAREGADEVGSSSHATDEEFCEANECIGDFEGEDGTVVECEDGSYSHAGGISGACSDHGGVERES